MKVKASSFREVTENMYRKIYSTAIAILQNVRYDRHRSVNETHKKDDQSRGN